MGKSRWFESTGMRELKHIISRDSHSTDSPRPQRKKKGAFSRTGIKTMEKKGKLFWKKKERGFQGKREGEIPKKLEKG